MGADAAGVFLAGDLERLAVVVLADAGRAERFGILPLQLGQIDHGAVHQDYLRLDPICPVAGVTVQFGHHQVKFLRAIQLGGEVDQTQFILGEQDGGLGGRFRVGGAGRGGQGEKDQQREAGLTGYVGHK